MTDGKAGNVWTKKSNYVSNEFRDKTGRVSPNHPAHNPRTQVAKLQETSLLVPSLDYLIQRLLWFSKAQLPYMARQTGTEW